MKILNFGSLNYDYVYSVDHILLPGETSAAWRMETFIGGKGLNQSVALSRAGAKVWHAGQVGEEGGQLLAMCRENGVNTEYIRQVPGKSGARTTSCCSAEPTAVFRRALPTRCLPRSVREIFFCCKTRSTGFRA